MIDKTYEFTEIVHKVPDIYGACVEFPYDVKAELHSGRVKGYVTFDSEPYNGSIVNMGVQNPDGSACYIIGIRKDVRAKIGKQPGDTIKVMVTRRISIGGAGNIERTNAKYRASSYHKDG